MAGPTGLEPAIFPMGHQDGLLFLGKYPRQEPRNSCRGQAL